jgi:hypothetical protein
MVHGGEGYQKSESMGEENIKKDIGSYIRI